MPAQVLIVEDDPPWRVLLRELVTSAGYEAIEAEEGFLAAQRAILERPDLIILDLGLPHIDGIRVLEELKQRTALAAIPIIVVSGRDDAETRRAVRELGSCHFISKSSDPEEILLALRSELGEHPPGS